MYFPAGFFQHLPNRLIQLDERHTRQSHRVGPTIGKEPFLEDLDRVCGTDPIDAEVTGAGDDRVPEFRDRRFRLFGVREELAEGSPGPREPTLGAEADHAPHRTLYLLAFVLLEESHSSERQR